MGFEDCYERLKLAVARQRGLSVVIGGAGYGKTTIKLALLDELRQDSGMAVGVVDDPRDCRTDVQFLRAILGQFGVDASGRTALDLTSAFLDALDELGRSRRAALLAIDEGHHLSSSQLEILRTLLSAEPTGRQSLQVVIVAEPEIEEKIARKRNLAQRVGMEHRLNPLNRRDTAGLIGFTLAGRPEIAITDEAVDVVYDHSGGVPRAVTEFAAVCLATADAAGRQEIDGALAAEAIGRRAASRNGAGDRVAQIPLALGDAAGMGAAT